MTRYRYWDACAFLGWLKAEPGKYEECKGVVDHAKRGEVQIVTSTISFAEVLYLKGEKPIPKEDRDAIRRFFESEFIDVYEVDRTIAELAQDVIWDHGAKPKDAIHLATAMSLAPDVELEQFDTFDEPLITLSGKLGSPRITIGRPNVQQGLF